IMSTKILIIDDDKALTFGIRAMLNRAGYRTKVSHNGHEGIDLVEKFNPDLIICDVMMPEISGFEVLEEITQRNKSSEIPFIFLTARTSQADKTHGLSEGADDYITKPFHSDELLLRIEAIIRRKKLTLSQSALQNKEKMSTLQSEIEELQKLIGIGDDFIDGLVNMLKLRDNETEEHARRVLDFSERMAEEVGITNSALQHMRWGVVLHDIGKIAIPDSILKKPGPLTKEEYETMKEHVCFAYQMLSALNLPTAVTDIPQYHHEKWDGSGYMMGLSGTDIPLSARLFTLVDVWDALTSDRPYRKAWSIEKTKAYFEEEKGKHFDPDLTDIFLNKVLTI
ncbi:MAG: response regulator, partial [Anaerolineae bacterium]|nr:response regulator [Anaerolineae bacterium]